MTKKKIRESTLAQVSLDLTSTSIQEVVDQYKNKFIPKLRAYSIFQHKVEDVVQESVKTWKIVFWFDN